MTEWSKLEAGMFLKHKPTGEKFEIDYIVEETLELMSCYEVIYNDEKTNKVIHENRLTSFVFKENTVNAILNKGCSIDYFELVN